MNKSAFVALVLTAFATGCNQGHDDKKLQRLEQSVSQLTKRIQEHTKEIDELKRQQIAFAPAKTEQPSRITDPAERFKKEILNPAIYETLSNKFDGTWSPDSYDIRKTDSIVTPLNATLVIKYTYGANVVIRYTAVFGLQEDQWELKALTLRAKQPKEDFIQEAKIGDHGDALFELSQVLRARFR